MITGGCPCPQDSALTSIPDVLCAENFGQIQKIAFQRIYKDDGTLNSFTAAAAITLLASWTPKLTANDSTKIVVSPFIEAPTNEAGAMREFGGGNETLGGIPSNNGREPNSFTSFLRKKPQSTIKAMKALQCESEAGNLGVFLINENGLIEAIKGETEGTYYPIPIRTLFVGDKSHGGLESPDSNALNFYFLPNYSDDLVVIKPDFNPLTQLKVVESGD